jgi:hypothetical protein
MIVHTIKVSQEINDFDLHYWVGMEASITPEEDEIAETKKLRKKIEMVYSSDIKVEKKEIEKPTLTPEETSSWKALVKTLAKLGNKEDALKYLEGNKEWCLSVEAKQIANSLKTKK